MKKTGENRKRYRMKRVLWGLLRSGIWGVGLFIGAQIHIGNWMRSLRVMIDSALFKISKSESTFLFFFILLNMNLSQQPRSQIYFPQFTQCDCVYCSETGSISIDSILFSMG